MTGLEANAGPLAQRSAPEREAYVRNFMRLLWENDFVSMGLGAGA